MRLRPPLTRERLSKPTNQRDIRIFIGRDIDLALALALELRTP